jgi:hypothetical protein
MAGMLGDNFQQIGPSIGKGLRNPETQDEFDNDVGPGTYDIKSTVPQLQCWEQARMNKEAVAWDPNVVMQRHIVD